MLFILCPASSLDLALSDVLVVALIIPTHVYLP